MSMVYNGIFARSHDPRKGDTLYRENGVPVACKTNYGVWLAPVTHTPTGQIIGWVYVTHDGPAIPKEQIEKWVPETVE